MKYLFFDLEESGVFHGRTHICEFGYVLTDEKYNVLKQGNFIINPKINRYEWDRFAVENILTRDIADYECAFNFNHYYPRIMELLKGADEIFGHTTDGDVDALNQEFIRYGHEAFDFHFHDIANLYLEMTGKPSQQRTSLEKMKEQLMINEGPVQLHDAQCDAYNTMLCMKQMEMNLNSTLDEIKLSYPSFNDETNDFIIKSVKERLAEQAIKDEERLKIDDGTNSLEHSNVHNRALYKIYLDNSKPKKEGKLKGKAFIFAYSYESAHFCQMVNLIRLINDNGGSVTREATKANFFVKDPIEKEEKLSDTRLSIALRINEKEEKIAFIEFNDLLNELEITEKELDDMDFPSFDFMYSRKAIIKDPIMKKAIKRKKEERKENMVEESYSTSQSSTTLGDMFSDVFDQLFESDE